MFEELRFYLSARASTGFNLEAFWAGYKPKNIPIVDVVIQAIMIDFRVTIGFHSVKYATT